MKWRIPVQHKYQHPVSSENSPQGDDVMVIVGSGVSLEGFRTRIRPPELATFASAFLGLSPVDLQTESTARAHGLCLPAVNGGSSYGMLLHS